MLGIEILERAHRERYTGRISAFGHSSFWEQGQLLAVTAIDDLAWVCQRLLNRGFVSSTFANSLVLEQPLSFLCFPQVSAIELKSAFLSRMYQNIFVFSMFKSEEWKYSSHGGRLRILRAENMMKLLQEQRLLSKKIGPLYWQTSKLWVRFLAELPEWLSHPSATQPMRQLVLDAPFEEYELLEQISTWQSEGLIQISESPANISAELTEEEKILFKDHDRYRGPQAISQYSQPVQIEEEEIALGDDIPSENSICIDEANQILARLKTTRSIQHPILIKDQNGFRLELPVGLYESSTVEPLANEIYGMFHAVQQQAPKALSLPELLRWKNRWLQ